jgi:tetratricopeptide (TPR) repeat protein
MALLEQSLAHFRALGDQWGISWSLRRLGQEAWERGEHERAVAFWEEQLALARTLGDKAAVAQSLESLGTAARLRGEYGRAAALYRESLLMHRASGDTHMLAWTLHNWGDLALAQGDLAAARARYEEGLALYRELAGARGLAHSLHGFAGLAAAQGQPERALRLAGAAAAVCAAERAPLTVSERLTRDRWLEPVRPQLPKPAATLAWAEGRAMPLEQAVAYALALPAHTASVHSPAAPAAVH